MFMCIPTRITLFVVTILLLSTACTPQLVREDETTTTANDTSGNRIIVNREHADATSEDISHNTGASASGKTKGEDPKERLTAPVEKPRPSPATAEPKANTELKLEVVAEPKNHPSLAANTTNPSRAPASQKRSDSKTKLPETNEPAQTSASSPQTGGKEIEIVAAQPTEKLETVSNKPEAAETPESVDDHQKLVMLTRQETLSKELGPGVPILENPPLNMAALPLSFGIHWSLDRRPNPIDHKAQCLLASRSVNISDGYDRTDVQLLLTAKSLYVSTESNLDLSYPDTGIRLDNGTLMPFEGLAKETAAIISSDVAMLYEQMAPSQTVLVRLGFWPTWPVTKTQEVSFPLDGFADAINALWVCESM